MKFVVLCYNPSRKYNWSMHAAGCADIQRELKNVKGATDSGFPASDPTTIEAANWKEAADQWIDDEMRKRGWSTDAIRINPCCKGKGKESGMAKKATVGTKKETKTKNEIVLPAHNPQNRKWCKACFKPTEDYAEEDPRYCKPCWKFMEADKVASGRAEREQKSKRRLEELKEQKKLEKEEGEKFKLVDEEGKEYKAENRPGYCWHAEHSYTHPTTGKKITVKGHWEKKAGTAKIK